MDNETDFKLLVHGLIDGPNFSPQALQAMTNLVFDEQHEQGDVFTRKQHQGVYGQGGATLTATATSLDERNTALDSVLDSLITHREAIRTCGGTSIGVWIAILESVKGNWAATLEQIQKLAAVGGSLAVTYYR